MFGLNNRYEYNLKEVVSYSNMENYNFLMAINDVNILSNFIFYIEISWDV